MFWIPGWDPVDAKGWLFIDIMPYYVYKGLAHPLILVCAGVLERIPHGCQGTTSVVKFWECQSYTWIFDCEEVGAPNLKAVQGSTVKCVLYRLIDLGTNFCLHHLVS